MTNSYVARQAIFDRRQRTVGYDLLFRSSDGGVSAPATETEQARAIVAALADIGLDGLVGDTRALLSAGPGLLVGGQIRVCPSDRIVIEVLESTAADPEAMQALRALVADGYEIALDDYSVDPPLAELLELAVLVKIDVTRRSDSELVRRLDTLRPYPKVLALADKVESEEEYERCYELGFDFFQGSYFARPRVRRGGVIGADKQTRLQVIASLQNPSSTPARLEALVAQDIALSHRILRFVNSAHTAMPRRIHSIREAIVLLGHRKLRLFATLVTLADSTSRPRELLVSALIRARMCELLAPAVDADPDSAFTVGLFSAADALLEIPMDELVDELPFAEDTKEALARHEGVLGNLLQIALTYERGDLVLACPGLAIRSCRAAYVEALDWSAEIGSLSTPAAAA